MGRDVGSNTTVKLTRLSDGAVWNFASGSSDYYINNDYYGQKGCIIFRPSGISSYNHGDAFEVEISGSGIEVKYTVNFFDPDKISGDNPVQTPTPTPELTMAPTPTPELTNVPTPTTNPASGIDFSDISFSFTDIRSNGYITFNGSDGTAKVLILGGVGTCSNTCSFIKSLSSFVPQMMENV